MMRYDQKYFFQHYFIIVISIINPSLKDLNFFLKK